MRWQLVLGEFGPNIQHISGVENMVADTLSRLSYTSVENYLPSTSESQCCAKELFSFNREENNEDCFPINLLIFSRRNTKVEEKNEFQTQRIHFRSGVQLLQARS